MQERLDKFISDNGGLTRSEAKKAVQKGRVTVNGTTVKKPEHKIVETDTVTLDSIQLCAVGKVYIFMYKPKGVLSATEDGKEKTVIDLVKENEKTAPIALKTDLFPIGRLDKDTEGILVLTNDGELSHYLTSPKRHVEKEYYAKCTGSPCKDCVERFAEGIMVGEEYRALPAGLEILSDNGAECELIVTLTEGKFHQVKRMCHEIGAEVTYLKRIRFGSLTIPDGMKPGDMMMIEAEDIIKKDEKYNENKA